MGRRRRQRIEEDAKRFAIEEQGSRRAALQKESKRPRQQEREIGGAQEDLQIEMTKGASIFSKVHVSKSGEFFVRGHDEEEDEEETAKGDNAEASQLPSSPPPCDYPSTKYTLPLRSTNKLSLRSERPLPFFGFNSYKDPVEYRKQVEESERFDVDYFPCTGQILTRMNLNISTVYRKATEFVVKRYSMRNKGRPIKMIRLRKCVCLSKPWPYFYVTFEGYDVAEKKVKTYQAVMMLVPGLKGNFVLRMLRPKPPKGAPIVKKRPHDECCSGCRLTKSNVWFGGSHVMDSYPGEYTLEDLETYFEQFEDSEGFDIDPFPGIQKLCYITFMQRPWRKEFAEGVDRNIGLIKDFFSQDKGVKLHDLTVIKVNHQQGHCCPHSFITFEAKDDANGEIKTYQARVITNSGREKVEEVRLKP